MEICVFFGASISSFCKCLGDFFEILVILSAILLSIKSQVASAVFWIDLFEAVFIAFVADFLALARAFEYIFFLNFYLCF